MSKKEEGMQRECVCVCVQEVAPQMKGIIILTSIS